MYAVDPYVSGSNSVDKGISESGDHVLTSSADALAAKSALAVAASRFDTNC